MVNYWFDVFTPKTWAEARQHSFTVTGFSEAKYGTVKQVKRSDVFICYLKGSKKIIGALRAAGKPYVSAEPPIWGAGAFPARVPVEPVVILEPDAAVDLAELLPRLSFYDGGNLRRTWARLQGSPTMLTGPDGALLFDALQGAGSESWLVPAPDSSEPMVGEASSPPATEAAHDQRGSTRRRQAGTV